MAGAHVGTRGGTANYHLKTCWGMPLSQPFSTGGFPSTLEQNHQ